MQSIQEAPVFQSAYDLLKAVHLARKKFDKSEKYSLGETLEHALLDVLCSIIQAGRVKSEWKISAIDSALLSLKKGRVLIRLAAELGQIDERRYISMQESMEKIGRMLGGWRKSV